MNKEEIEHGIIEQKHTDERIDKDKYKWIVDIAYDDKVGTMHTLDLEFTAENEAKCKEKCISYLKEKLSTYEYIHINVFHIFNKYELGELEVEADETISAQREYDNTSQSYYY